MFVNKAGLLGPDSQLPPPPPSLAADSVCGWMTPAAELAEEAEDFAGRPDKPRLTMVSEWEPVQMHPHTHTPWMADSMGGLLKRPSELPQIETESVKPGIRSVGNAKVHSHHGRKERKGRSDAGRRRS